MISKSKTLIKLIIFYIIDLIIFPSKEKKPKSLLLIRLDAIGDYVLFRNYIEVLKKSTKYKDYSITLLGNSAWKGISEELDNEYIGNYIWINRERFIKDFSYRYKKLRKITSQGYDIVLSPVYSREYFMEDTIVKLIRANQKIGSIGDLTNIKKWRKKISNKFYTKLIPANDQIIFEFQRNKEFFQYLLDEFIDIEKPMIDPVSSMQKFSLPTNYIVLFIGASAKYKTWNLENFVEVATYIHEHHGCQIVICGGPKEREESERFVKLFKKRAFNFVGKTTLSELSAILSNAKLLVSNETGAVHIAVAVNTYVLVLSNGNHYGRFHPYPKEITDRYTVVYPPAIEEQAYDHNELAVLCGKSSDLDINDIVPKRVLKEIDRILLSYETRDVDGQ